jgi:aryl-alcohol dehydrogenase-like predicted oxidoreductase
VEYSGLSNTGLRVSRVCLGTMTLGSRNSEAEAFRQLDAALDAGVNFIDLGEMYPIPPRPETIGLTEAIVGRWLASRGVRERVVLAGKAVGKVTKKLPFHRGGSARLDRRSIDAYVDEALQRLGTDRLDLLQSHWPDRSTIMFGERYYRHEPEQDGVDLLETLEVFDDLLRAGKIRAHGVSNETPWGLMRSIALAEAHNRSRPAVIQNAYNLLNRSFEVGLSEVVQREGCAVMAYSPLAFGVLTGKYLGGARPEGARMTLHPEFTRYMAPEAEAPTRAYVDLARMHGLDPVEMAIAFVLGRPFVTSVVIGATSDEQLAACLKGATRVLSPEIEADIDAIGARYPDPCP